MPSDLAPVDPLTSCVCLLTSSLQGFLAVLQADLAHGDPRTFAPAVAFAQRATWLRHTL